MFKPWDWKISETRSGPDYFLNVTFASGHGESLRQLFAHNIPNGYVADPTAPHSYCDAVSAEKLLRRQETGNEENIWTYDWLVVGDDTINAETGYGYTRPPCVPSLTQYVAELARNRPIQKWDVSAGGQGYNHLTLAQGQNSASFLEYLSLVPVPHPLPNWNQFRDDLLVLVQQSPYQELFQLETFEAKTRMCAFRLSFREDVTDEVRRNGGLRIWNDGHPLPKAAVALANTLAQKYHLPLPQGSSIEDKADLILRDNGESIPRTIAFVMILGYWDGTGYDAPWEFS